MKNLRLLKWCVTLCILVSGAISTTLLSTTSNDDCRTCLNSSSTMVCKDSTQSSTYCCNSGVSSASCSSCSDTSFYAMQYAYCSSPQSQCGETTLTIPSEKDVTSMSSS